MRLYTTKAGRHLALQELQPQGQAPAHGAHYRRGQSLLIVVGKMTLDVIVKVVECLDRLELGRRDKHLALELHDTHQVDKAEAVEVQRIKDNGIGVDHRRIHSILVGNFLV